MKSKYLVYQTKWIDEDGTPILKYVKTFRHEPEALAYINAHENDDVYLDREDSDGKRYEWDANSKSWERIYGEGEIE